MRGSRFRIDEAFTRGLAVGPHVPANAPYLAELRNAKPSKGGLAPYIPVVAAPYVGTPAWPYPQVVAGSRWILHLEVATVRRIDPQTGTVSVLPLYDARDGVTPAAIPAGGPWHVAEWGDFWLAVNGACMMYALPGEAFARVETQCYPKTACSFRGRPVFGGIVGYEAEWSEFWDTWLNDAPEELQGAVALGANDVCWGSILGGDALHWFRSDLATSGWVASLPSDGVAAPVNDADHPLWMDTLRQNQVGFTSMPWTGDVLAVHAMDSAVLVYGENRVMALVPVAGPFPTFGGKDVFATGIPSRGAAAATEREQVFLDAKGMLHVVQADLSVERLDYSRHLASMVAESPVIVPGAIEHEYYISSSARAYRLTPSGLHAIGERVSGAYSDDGVIKGVASAITGQGTFRAVTWIIDFGIRGIKNITGLFLGTRNPSSITVSVEHRSDAGGSFTATTPTAPTRDGFVPLHVSGAEFRVVIEGAAAPDIDYVDVIWNQGGKANFASL